jgi:hypothetical protein
MKPPFPPSAARVAARARVVAMAFVAASMAACSLSRESVAKQTFLLEPTPPPMASVQKLTSLRIGLVNVAAPYRSKAFVYRQGELKYEADFYSEFFVSPAAMLSEATARALSAANVFRRTVPPSASDPATTCSMDSRPSSTATCAIRRSLSQPWRSPTTCRRRTRCRRTWCGRGNTGSALRPRRRHPSIREGMERRAYRRSSLTSHATSLRSDLRSRVRTRPGSQQAGPLAEPALAVDAP